MTLRLASFYPLGGMGRVMPRFLSDALFSALACGSVKIQEPRWFTSYLLFDAAASERGQMSARKKAWLTP